MAPEMIQSTSGYDGKQTDVWSCGVMLFVMLFGQYPFEEVQQPPRAASTAAAAGGGGAAAAESVVMEDVEPHVDEVANLRKNAGSSLILRIMTMQWKIPADKPVSKECEDLLRRLIVQV